MCVNVVIRKSKKNHVNDDALLFFFSFYSCHLKSKKSLVSFFFIYKSEKVSYRSQNDTVLTTVLGNAQGVPIRYGTLTFPVTPWPLPRMFVYLVCEYFFFKQIVFFKKYKSSRTQNSLYNIINIRYSIPVIF